MMRKLAIFVAFMLVFGLTNGAFAHKSQVIGNYEIEVGWENEPALVGQENAITVMITNTPEDADEEMTHDDEEMTHDDEEMTHDSTEESEHEDHESMDSVAEHDHEEGISGLESMFDSYVTLNDKKTPLEFVEDQNLPGMYVAQYTPDEAGYPVIHLVVTINDDVVEADFHPEEVEHTMMSPLAQQKEGISPNEVECNDDKVLMSKTSDGSAICVTESTAETLLARSWATYF